MACRMAGARRRILVPPKGEPVFHFLSRRFCVCSSRALCVLSACSPLRAESRARCLVVIVVVVVAVVVLVVDVVVSTHYDDRRASVRASSDIPLCAFTLTLRR